MKIVDDLKNGHATTLEAIGGLTAEELTRAETIGRWSARDLILHLAMWDGEAVKAFAVWRTGHEYDWSYAKEYLKFNEFWVGNLKHLDVNQVVQMFNLLRNALVCDFSSVPEEIWNVRGAPDWLQGAIIDHTIHHAEKLRAYRKSLGK
jgi:hypothetical protein